MPSLPERIRRAIRGRLDTHDRGASRSGDRRPDPRERDAMGETASEFTVDELHEFLQGDLLPPRANPDFKEQLRDEMWDLVQECYGDAKDED